MFNGEKTAVFWLGLVVFGYSIYQFCIAGWQIVYYNFIFPAVFSNSSSTIGLGLLQQSLIQTVPAIISGIIFVAIGLYIMKVGVKKDNPQTIG